MQRIKWLKGAVLLGIVFFLAVFVIKPIGVSTQFSVASGIFHSWINPSIIQADETSSSGYSSTNAYYNKSGGSLARSIKNPMNYDFIFVLAIPLGGFLGFAGDKLKRKQEIANQLQKIDLTTEKVPVDRTAYASRRPSIVAYLPAFVGGFLLLFGARMADGCTSGHMMSGMMQGSISGYLFAAAVFSAAIPTAILMKKYAFGKEG